MSFCETHQKEYHTVCLPCAFKKNLSDPVSNPPHYNKGGIECIDAIMEAVKDLQGIEAVCVANVIKYTWRWKQKNGIEDLKKAKWYLEWLIDGIDAS
jgi:hypothetical protein